MSRNRNSQVESPESVDEVDVPEATPEDVPSELTSGDTQSQAPAKTKEQKRPTPPDGYVTPIGFRNLLVERGLVAADFRPQVIYSYIKNSESFRKDAVRTDLEGKEDGRPLVNIEAGVAWVQAKDQRVAERKANAAQKAAAKETKAQERAAGTANEAEDVEPSAAQEPGEVVEAE